MSNAKSAYITIVFILELAYNNPSSKINIILKKVNFIETDTCNVK